MSLINTTLASTPSRALERHLGTATQAHELNGSPTITLRTGRGLTRVAASHDIVVRIGRGGGTPELGVVERIVTGSLQSHVQLSRRSGGPRRTSGEEGNEREKSKTHVVSFSLLIF